MIVFKNFNRFLVTGLLLAGQMLSIQAFDEVRVNKEITRINRATDVVLKVDFSSCQITSDDLEPILTKIDHKQSGRIKTITLYNNQINALPNNFYTLLPNLEFLNLSYNLLGENTTSLLYIPTTVASLWLNNNSLTELPKNFVSRLKDLRIIVLNDNPNLELQPTLLTELINSTCKTIDLTKTMQETHFNKILAEGIHEQNEKNRILLDFLATFDGNKKTLIAKFNLNSQKIAINYKNALDKINDLQNQIAGKNETIRNICIDAFRNLEDEALQ